MFESRSIRRTAKITLSFTILGVLLLVSKAFTTLHLTHFQRFFKRYNIIGREKGVEELVGEFQCWWHLDSW